MSPADEFSTTEAASQSPKDSATRSPDVDGHFTLAAWCTATMAWVDRMDRFASVAEAQDAATKARGIYRIAYVRNGRRVDLEPFGFIGDD